MIGQTPCLKRKGKVPKIGRVMLDFELSDGAVIRSSTAKQIRMTEIANDYLHYPVPVEGGDAVRVGDDSVGDRRG